MDNKAVEKGNGKGERVEEKVREKSSKWEFINMVL